MLQATACLTFTNTKMQAKKKLHEECQLNFRSTYLWSRTIRFTFITAV